MSASLIFPCHENVDQKFETTSNHDSAASNTKGTQKKDQQWIGIFNCILPGLRP